MPSSPDAPIITHHQAHLRTSYPELRLYYIDACPPPSTPQKGTLLLIHGFPQTSYQFRHVIPLFTAHGYRVLAPDYRGAGYSSKPPTGYTKTVLATDLHTLLTSPSHLAIKDKVHIIGHDIGGMIAHAYAHLFPEDVASLVWGECPLPGTSAYAENKRSDAMWHFSFHRQLDLPEALVAGNEKVYLQHFFDRLAVNPSVFAGEALDFYARQYACAGALRAGFNVYRAFEEDAAENVRMLAERGKVTVRAMVLSGEGSLLGEWAEEMAQEVNEAFEVKTVAGAGHWIAEENPEGFVEAVVAFVGGGGGGG